MPRQEYHKLVRDQIPQIIEQAGDAYEVVVMNDDEYRESLRLKLVEESQEVLVASPDELVKELADVYEVLETLIKAHGLDEKIIRQMQEQRRASRGGFLKKLKLIWSES